MATVTAAMVKELRDATGAGMMDCKKALVAADGNMQAAIDAMRKSGAAKAAITYLLDNGIDKLYVVSRDKSPKEGLDERAVLIDYEDLKEIKGDILVNTTPVGMYPNVGKSPVGENIVNNFSSLVDLIYNPKETEFLRLGNLLGKKTCGGLYMLVGQAIKSEEIWQNRTIDEKILNEIYEELNKEFI